MEKDYLDVYRQGRPRHGPYDEFALRHPQMPLGQRAKIFSPFDALKGFSETIGEKLQLYVDKRELTEEEQAALDRTLARLAERTRSRRLVREEPVFAEAVYYVPCADENHEAYGLRGRYETARGTVWKVDELARTVQIGETVIDFADLAELHTENIGEETEDVLPLLYGDVAPDRGGSAEV